ncbi:hypothetical protein CO994_00030 [Enterococcus faecium]|nr:hypothetical protein CO994_00030 [Enterococcus faecium]
MKNFDTYYVIVFSISLLLILLTLMQYKEYPEYFILTFVYLVSSYTLLYKFRSSSRVKSTILCKSSTSSKAQCFAL